MTMYAVICSFSLEFLVPGLHFSGKFRTLNFWIQNIRSHLESSANNAEPGNEISDPIDDSSRDGEGRGHRLTPLTGPHLVQGLTAVRCCLLDLLHPPSTTNMKLALSSIDKVKYKN